MKKAALTFLILLVTFSAQAVETAYCPRVLTVLAQAVKLPPLTEELLPASQREEHFKLMKETQREFSWEPTIDIRFNLSFAGAGRCHYEGWDFQGNSIQARIQGSTLTGAKEPATLLIYGERKALEISLKEVSRKGVIAKDEEVKLSYRLKSCGAVRCRAKLYPIGQAVLDDLY